MRFQFHLPSRFLERLRLHRQSQLVLISIVVGVTAGLLAAAFRYLVEFLNRVLTSLWGTLTGLGAEKLRQLQAGSSFFGENDRSLAFLLLLLPITGAAALWLLARIAPNYEYGYTFPRFLMAVNLRGGIVRLRDALVRAMSAAITIGSGASAGVEGPVAQLGGGAGSSIGRFIQASGSRMRLLVASGVAAAIAANFNAPITGVLFAFEIVLLGNFELASFSAIVICSGVGTVISRWIFGNAPVFYPPEFSYGHPLELPMYAVLGALCGLLGGLFLKFFLAMQSLIGRLPGSLGAKLFAGSIAVGLIASVFPQVMGAGYNVVQASLNGAYPPIFLAGAWIAKALATAITLGAGMGGGMFGPSLTLGAMLGSVVGSALQAWVDVPIKPSGFAMLGMGGFLTAITRAPLTSMFLLFELTGSYQIVVPAMFVTVAAFIVGQRVSRRGLDNEILHRIGVNLEEGRDASVLASIAVRDVMQPGFSVVNRRTPFRELVKLFSRTQETYFPVVDDDGRMEGILSFQDVRSVLFEESLADVLVAGELATRDVITLYPNDSLQTALRRFNLKDIASIPVVDPQDPRKVLGMLQRKDVLDAYNRELLKREVTQF